MRATDPPVGRRVTQIFADLNAKRASSNSFVCASNLYKALLENSSVGTNDFVAMDFSPLHVIIRFSIKLLT